MIAKVKICPLDEVEDDVAGLPVPGHLLEDLAGLRRREVGRLDGGILVAHVTVETLDQIRGQDDLACSLQSREKTFMIKAVVILVLVEQPVLDVLVSVDAAVEQGLPLDVATIFLRTVSTELATKGVVEIHSFLVKLLDGLVQRQHLVNPLDVERVLVIWVDR